MANEQFTTLRPTCTSESEHLTNRHQLEYATQRARVLFGCYRRGDANDPDQYVASIAAVLALYNVEIIRKATDPRTGISTEEKFATFMPNSGELKIYCDGLRERHFRAENSKWERRALPPMPSPKKAPGTSYTEMVEKHGRPIGPFEHGGC